MVTIGQKLTWLSYILNYLIAICAGAMLPLAFAPFKISWLGFISLTLLGFCWQQQSNKANLITGWLFGISFYTVGINWIFHSIHVHGNTHFALALLLTALFISGLALFPAIQGWILTRYVYQQNPYKWLIAYPASWVISEWMRSWLFSGFPWLLLGYSQTEGILRGYAPIFGIYGLTFIIALISGIIIIFKLKLKILIPTISIIFTVGYLLIDKSWTQQSGHYANISVVQGNIPQPLKWSSEHTYNTLLTYVNLTQNHLNSDIIIWPETAIPLAYSNAKNYLQPLLNKAKLTNTSLIMGAPIIANNHNYYNAIVLEDHNTSYYYKNHLVPFGEYLPFEAWLRGLINFFDIPMSSFIAGSNKQATFKTKNLTIAPFICYEIAYSDTVLRYLPEADIFLTITNDAWFGDSLAPAQHLQIAQMRALQTGRWLVFASNDGITAVISNTGTILKQLPQFTTSVLNTTVTGMQGATPWAIIGDKPIIFLIFVLLLTPLMRRVKYISILPTKAFSPK